MPGDKEHNPTQAELLARIESLENEIKEYEQAAAEDRTRSEKNRETVGRTGGFFGRVFAWAFLGSGLFEKSRELWDAWSGWLDGNRKNWPRATTRDWLASLLSRFTRLGVFAALVAIAPLVFISTQTWLLCNQNRLLDAQNNLVESNRRSALTFELSAILNEMNRELDARERALTRSKWKSMARAREIINDRYGKSSVGFDYEGLKQNGAWRRELNELGFSVSVFPRLKSYSIQPRLSRRLQGRIIALNKILRPYRYLDQTGRLIRKGLSPERGQLLIALVESGVDLEGLIARQSFAAADISGTQVSRLQTTEVSGFAGFNLTSLDLPYAGLDGAVFRRVLMEFARFEDSSLEDAEFHNVILEYAKFPGAKMRDAFFKAPHARYADFTGADLTNAKFHGGDLREAKFTNAKLKDTAFCMAVMPRCATTGTGAKLLAADFSSVKFQGTIVHRQDWFKCLAKVGKAPSAAIQAKLKFHSINSRERLQALEGSSLLPKTMYIIIEKGVTDLPCYKTSDDLNRN